MNFLIIMKNFLLVKAIYKIIDKKILIINILNNYRYIFRLSFIFLKSKLNYKVDYIFNIYSYKYNNYNYTLKLYKLIF